MHHRAEYLLQVLEKIGAPLLVSISDVNARGAGSPGNEAQKIAELLAKTVQTSIDMSHALDLGPTGSMTDSIRIALAGLAGPLVAGSYRNTTKTPTDPEIKRMVAALQAVLSFAENFEANSENAGRLKNLGAQGQPVDAAQAHIQYVQAFVPVVNVVSAFSFGQPEQKMVMEIASQLTARAEASRKAMLGDLGDDNKRAELGILKALTELYASCHAEETARIQSLSEDERAQMQLSTETLWKSFDAGAAILEALAQGIVPGTGGTGKSGSGGGVRPAPPVQTQAAEAPPPVSPPPAAPPAQQQGGSPMSFFKAPPKG